MATCHECEQDMLTADGCKISHLAFYGGHVYERIRYASAEENQYWGSPDTDMPERCHDCNVKPGELHHLGCDVERCPGCHHQLISCDEHQIFDVIGPIPNSPEEEDALS